MWEEAQERARRDVQRELEWRAWARARQWAMTPEELIAQAREEWELKERAWHLKFIEWSVWAMRAILLFVVNVLTLDPFGLECGKVRLWMGEGGRAILLFVTEALQGVVAVLVAFLIIGLLSSGVRP